MASNRIAITRAFGDRFFDDDSENIIGVIIIAPFHNRKSRTGWGYASALIANPRWRNPRGTLDKLAALQL
jgi:hypothetical protein